MRCSYWTWKMFAGTGPESAETRASEHVPRVRTWNGVYIFYPRQVVPRKWSMLEILLLSAGAEVWDFMQCGRNFIIQENAQYIQATQNLVQTSRWRYGSNTESAFPRQSATLTRWQNTSYYQGSKTTSFSNLPIQHKNYLADGRVYFADGHVRTVSTATSVKK